MKWIAGILAGIGIAALTTGLVLLVTNSSDDESTTTEVASTKTSNHAADRSAEHIEVHGHWTIDVYNPGGGLVRRASFENDLTIQGEKWLAQLLTGETQVAWWNLVVKGDPRPCPNAWPENPSNPAIIDTCHLWGNAGIQATQGGWVSANVVTTDTSDGAYGEITLSGSYVFEPKGDETTGAISQVMSVICSEVPEFRCSNYFTVGILPDPVQLLPDQLVNIELLFTFGRSPN